MVEHQRSEVGIGDNRRASKGLFKMMPINIHPQIEILVHLRDGSRTPAWEARAQKVCGALIENVNEFQIKHQVQELYIV